MFTVNWDWTDDVTVCRNPDDLDSVVILSYIQLGEKRDLFVARGERGVALPVALSCSVKRSPVAALRKS